jgi:hypothetical protein
LSSPLQRIGSPPEYASYSVTASRYSHFDRARTHDTNFLLIDMARTENFEHDAAIFKLPNIILVTMPEKFTPAVFDTIGAVFTYCDIGFTIQEISLSSLYIYLFIRFMRQGGSHSTQEAVGMFYFLIIIEGLVIMSDALLNTLVYLHTYSARRMILAFTYAFKLRIELIVLNRIRRFRLVRQAQLEEGVGGESGLGSTVTEVSPFHLQSRATTCIRQVCLDKRSDSIGPDLGGPNIAGGRALNAVREREISVLAQVSDGNGVQGNTL